MGLGRNIVVATGGILALGWLFSGDNEDLAARVTQEQAVAAGFANLGEYRDALGRGVLTKAEFDELQRREAFYTPPPKQRSFVQAVVSARDAFEAAPNDLAKGGARAARARAICNALAGTKANGWTGTISELSSNSDGKGVLRIAVAPEVSVATWNNALSDYGSETLIEPSSALFGKLAGLAEGDRVKFSGGFFRNDVDCVAESSVTLSGSMTAPYFIMRFSAVETMD